MRLRRRRKQRMDRSDHVAGVLAEMLEAQSGPGTKRPPQWAGVGKLWEAFQALSQSASQTYCTPPLRSLPDTWSRCERYGSSGDIGYRSPVRVFATPAQHRLER